MEKLKNLAGKIEEEIKTNRVEGTNPPLEFEKYKSNFVAAMDEDFNSPQACAVIFDFIRDVNRAIAENENINVQFYLSVKEFLQKTAEGVLGIMDFTQASALNDGALENDLIELLIKLRHDAKLEKNYALSDKIRNELKAIGIELQDSKTGTTYKKNKK